MHFKIYTFTVQLIITCTAFSNLIFISRLREQACNRIWPVFQGNIFICGRYGRILGQKYITTLSVCPPIGHTGDCDRFSAKNRLIRLVVNACHICLAWASVSSSSLVYEPAERPITCRNATTTDQCDVLHQNRGRQLIDKYPTVFKSHLVDTPCLRCHWSSHEYLNVLSKQGVLSTLTLSKLWIRN